MTSTPRWCHAIAVVLSLAVGCKQREPGDAPGRTPDPGARVAAEPAPPAGPPIALSILYGSEKKTWLEQQLAAFHASKPTTKAGRPIVVTAKPIGSGEAMTAILEGTEKPDVFSPASSAYLTLLNEGWQSRDGHTRPLAPAG
ncbi:MAG TPA: substrate-binding domain-containing protein, partial [Kofleriaceae bacterium]|nr:substrate-binding domain-containing protein [Kofleriaceae bacterium]